MTDNAIASAENTEPVGTATVRVRFFAAARETMGLKETTVSGGTVREVIERLGVDASPEARTVLARSSCLVNSVASTDFDQPVAAGDVIDVLPPFAGG